MALTYTPAPELGALCPDFTLPATDGRTYSKKDFMGSKALAIMFICNHCPYVKAIEDRLLDLGREMGPKGVQFVAICSNDSAHYPEDSFANLQKRAREKDYPFPYLHDDSQEVAQRFGAVCTPDFFIYDANGQLAYRGRLDDAWKEPTQVKSQELKAALQALIAGQKPSAQQVPSMGCSIKWRK